MRVIRDDIPSLELQTLMFVQSARALKLDQTVELEWNGFKVTVGYSGPRAMRGQVLKEAITLHSVFVPVKHRRKRWFTFYIEFLKILTEDAVIVTNVQGGFVMLGLARRGFDCAWEETFYYRKLVEPDDSSVIVP
jgi:hypothetical protein